MQSLVRLRPSFSLATDRTALSVSTSGTPCRSRQFLRLYCSWASFSSWSEAFSRSRWATRLSSSQASSVVWAVVCAMSIDTDSNTSCFTQSRIGPHLVMASTIFLTKSELPVNSESTASVTAAIVGLRDNILFRICRNRIPNLHIHM